MLGSHIKPILNILILFSQLLGQHDCRNTKWKIFQNYIGKVIV